MPLKYIDDGGYGAGVNRDTPPLLLSRGEVYDSSNLIYDRPGVARTRSGTSALSALGAVAAIGTGAQFTSYSDVTPALMAVNGKTGSYYNVNSTTGARSAAIDAVNAATYGRGVQHFGFIFFPAVPLALGPSSLFTAGCVVAALFGNAGGVVNAVAGSKTLTLTAPDTTANLKVGSLIYATSATFSYFGRVSAILTGTTVSVWPTPTHTVAYAIGTVTGLHGLSGPNARCAASFQNRLLISGTQDNSATFAGDRRITYSLLPTEEFAVATFGNVYGATFWSTGTAGSVNCYPTNNFIDVPGTDPFVAMEAVSDNELLILSARRPVVFRGNLVTQTSTTTQQTTFDVSEMDKIAGCSNDLSVQRTPRGIMWAGVDGVFIYTGSDAVNVLEGKMATYWRQLARSTTFAVHGSAYLRGHYLVAATSGGTAFQLLINLASREYTFAPLTGLDCFHAIQLPTDPARVYSMQWWDQAGAAPNFTNGQCIRIESILDPFSNSAVSTDSTGSNVSWSFTSRVLAADEETQKIFVRATVRYQQYSVSAATAVAAKSSIDPSESGVSAVALGSLSNTTPLVASAATNATPIVVTTTTHGLQTDDFVDIAGGLVNTHVNGRWRITVLSGTTFSLNGSSGNGAYTASSAMVRKVPEQDFMLTASIERGQGIVFTLSSSTIIGFELHGLRIACYDNDPVMSA